MRFILFTLLVTALFSNFNILHVLGDDTNAELMISQAEDSLNEAYQWLIKAEKSGGDVSELVLLFNSILEYFSEAQSSLELGNFDTAILMANKVVETSNTILNIDINLLVIAARIELVKRRNQLLISLGASCFIILFSFLSWRWFKGYYYRRIKEMKPEIIFDRT